MANYSFADIGKWIEKVDRGMDLVVKQATVDMLADIDVIPGIARGGSPKRGTIPRDKGALALSLQSSLYGSSAISMTGTDSYVMVAGKMKAGDVATFVWGGNVAPYARAIHYGWGTYPGTFWRDVAAGKWPSYVKAAIVRAKALIG